MSKIKLKQNRQLFILNEFKYIFIQLPLGITQPAVLSFTTIINKIYFYQSSVVLLEFSWLTQ